MKRSLVVLGMLTLVPTLMAARPSSVLRTGETEMSTMEQTFEFQIKRTSDDAAFSSRGPKEGNHVGSGEGTVHGGLEGTVRWSLYENSYAQACTMQFVGEILTDDGVKIPFEGQGLAIVPDHNAPSRWATSGAFRFEPVDGRYAWLDSRLIPWEGDFNMDTLEARLSFYAPPGE